MLQEKEFFISDLQTKMNDDFEACIITSSRGVVDAEFAREQIFWFTGVGTYSLKGLGNWQSPDKRISASLKKRIWYKLTLFWGRRQPECWFIYSWNTYWAFIMFWRTKTRMSAITGLKFWWERCLNRLKWNNIAGPVLDTWHPLRSPTATSGIIIFPI